MLTSRKAQLLYSTLTWRKIQNLARIHASFHYSKFHRRSYHQGNPVKIGIEPTTHCNLRCPECPSGLRSFTRPTGMMAINLYKCILDQVDRDLIYLLLYFQGEPFLHPQFFEMAQYAAQKSIYSATSTNGHYLDKNRARATVESGLSEIIVSIDGTTQETYEAYRIGGNLQRVLDGVSNLVSCREKLRSLSPHIILQFLVVRPNEHQVEDIKTIGQKLGVDKVILKTAQIYDFKHGNDLMPTQNRYSRYQKNGDGTYKIKNRLNNQCWKMWQGAEITWDGRVLPCCFDKDAQYEMGKMPERSFHDIWRSNQYHTFRQKLLHSRSTIDICTNCSEGMKVWE